MRLLTLLEVQWASACIGHFLHNSTAIYVCMKCCNKHNHFINEYKSNGWYPCNTREKIWVEDFSSFTSLMGANRAYFYFPSLLFSLFLFHFSFFFVHRNQNAFDVASRKVKQSKASAIKRKIVRQRKRKRNIEYAFIVLCLLLLFLLLPIFAFFKWLEQKKNLFICIDFDVIQRRNKGEFTRSERERKMKRTFAVICIASERKCIFFRLNKTNERIEWNSMNQR